MTTIHQTKRHFGWDNSIEPVAVVGPGDKLEFDVVDASNGQITSDSTAATIEQLDADHVNPVTGPIYVDGAEPGDTLVVDIVDFTMSNWGWTAIIPGFGLLADEFPKPFLNIASCDETSVELAPGIRIPARPFPGTIGVAPAEPGVHSVIPPRRVGGNMDTRDLVRGTRLRLPVEVDGALFSVGDTHAAQGDGEVCGTAVESPMQVRLAFGLEKQTGLRRPQIEVPPDVTASHPSDAGFYITTGVTDDLMAAARDAIRDMIDYMGREYDLDPEFAYCLCSVAVDLRISEVVDAPNWVVSAHLPRGVFHTK